MTKVLVTLWMATMTATAPPGASLSWGIDGVFEANAPQFIVKNITSEEACKNKVGPKLVADASRMGFKAALFCEPYQHEVEVK